MKGNASTARNILNFLRYNNLRKSNIFSSNNGTRCAYSYIQVTQVRLPVWSWQHVGLNRLREIFSVHEVEDKFDSDELVIKLREMQESVTEQFEVDDREETLTEKLAKAVAKEEYELAAKLRDELSKRSHDQGS